MRRISVSVAWNPDHIDDAIALARDADAAGVESLWINEGFGHDAFSGLAVLARETERIKLGTSIVNVFSRTPGALAQHFATIDQLSGGRVLVGLGASAPGAIERFHGLPFARPLERLQETAELIRRYWSKQRFDYDGVAHHVERALPMGVDPVQPAPPIYFATLHPRSVRLTAELADGWLPAWIPLERLADAVRTFRAAAADAGRDGGALTVRAPGSVVVAEDAEAVRRAREGLVGGLAFFAARNGPFYYRQFVRQGLADEAAAIRAAWDDGPAAAAALAAPLADRFGVVGDIEVCLERIAAQAEAGVDLHQVQVPQTEPGRRRELLSQLVG